MARSVMFDQYHLSIFVRRGLPEQDYRAIRRVLKSTRFVIEMRRGVQAVINKYPALRKTRITVTS